MCTCATTQSFICYLGDHSALKISELLTFEVNVKNVMDSGWWTTKSYLNWICFTLWHFSMFAPFDLSQYLYTLIFSKMCNLMFFNVCTHWIFSMYVVFNLSQGLYFVQVFLQKVHFQRVFIFLVYKHPFCLNSFFSSKIPF